MIETAEHIKAAEEATRQLNAQYMTVIQEGKYTDLYLTNAGKDAPKFTDADLKTISSPLDFVGINIYTPTYVRADGSKQGFRRCAESRVVSAYGFVVAQHRT